MSKNAYIKQLIQKDLNNENKKPEPAPASPPTTPEAVKESEPLTQKKGADSYLILGGLFILTAAAALFTRATENNNTEEKNDVTT